jgi:hypothetical protein
VTGHHVSLINAKSGAAAQALEELQFDHQKRGTGKIDAAKSAKLNARISAVGATEELSHAGMVISLDLWYEPQTAIAFPAGIGTPCGVGEAPISASRTLVRKPLPVNTRRIQVPEVGAILALAVRSG